MAKKSNSLLSPRVLFAAGTLLFTAGWLMKSFPLLIFVGLAPFLAIVDQGKEDERFWNLSELILVGLTISFFAAHVFQFQFLVVAISQSIALTLAFVGYAFAYQSLGSRLGKFTIIIFWLGIEYVLLKTPFRNQIIFLSDSLQLQPTWQRWNIYTGYLGSTLWILLTNLFIYLSLLKTEKINRILVGLSILCVAGPIIFSVMSEELSITRLNMLNLYDGDVKMLSKEYMERGELIPRTAAWVSGLIILLSLVKNKTKK
jgi:apolipoprotein N-acyltransferase